MSLSSTKAMQQVRKQLPALLADMRHSDFDTAERVRHWFDKNPDNGPYDIEALFFKLELIQCETTAEQSLKRLLIDLYETLYRETRCKPDPTYKIGICKHTSVKQNAMNIDIELVNPTTHSNTPNMYILPIPNSIVEQIQNDAIQAYLASKE